MITYTPELEAQIRAWTQSKISPKRFAHVERVVETVTDLAKKWSPDNVMVCRLAGWIHDAAKSYTDEKMLDTARRYNLPITSFDEQVPSLLHGIVAYTVAADHFGLHDDRLRTACLYHTAGSDHMNLIDKLVYLADKTEPARDFPGVDKIREAMFENIDWALWLFIDGNIRYLLDRMKTIDPRSIDFYNTLVTTLSSRRSNVGESI